MNNNSIYTRRINGLDRRVWYVMLLVIVISLGLLSYTVINKKECAPVQFAIKVLAGERSDTTYIVGETLFFESISRATGITWNFGDGSAESIGRNTTHKFQSAGDFIITVSTGMGCETNRRITVKNAAAPQQKNLTEYPTGGEIVGPTTTIFTGKEVSFICIVDADTYEWSIENMPKMTRTGPTAKFIFPRPGRYLVQVMLNNDRNKRFGKEIVVQDGDKDDGLNPKPLIPKDDQPIEPYNPPPREAVKESTAKIPADTPATATPVKPKSIYIADAVFLNYLEKVVNKEMTVQDFDKYLCGGGGTPVVVNGDQAKPKTFAWLCNELSTKKKKMLVFSKTIKIESAQLHRINGCVSLIDVKY